MAALTEVEFIWKNGEFIPWAEATTHVLSHSLHYGSGVFEGIRCYEGENAKTSKVDAIVREIGKQPVLAFGNSSGDAAMLTYTLSENAYPSASFMVLADDDVREYGDATEAAEERAEWEDAGFTVFSMKDDFATIYGEGVQKAPVK